MCLVEISPEQELSPPGPGDKSVEHDTLVESHLLSEESKVSEQTIAITQTQSVKTTVIDSISFEKAKEPVKETISIEYKIQTDSLESPIEFDKTSDLIHEQPTTQTIELDKYETLEQPTAQPLESDQYEGDFTIEHKHEPAHLPEPEIYQAVTTTAKKTTDVQVSPFVEVTGEENEHLQISAAMTEEPKLQIIDDERDIDKEFVCVTETSEPADFVSPVIITEEDESKYLVSDTTLVESVETAHIEEQALGPLELKADKTEEIIVSHKQIMDQDTQIRTERTTTEYVLVSKTEQIGEDVIKEIPPESLETEREAKMESQEEEQMVCRDASVMKISEAIFIQEKPATFDQRTEILFKEQSEVSDDYVGKSLEYQYTDISKLDEPCMSAESEKPVAEVFPSDDTQEESTELKADDFMIVDKQDPEDKEALPTELTEVHEQTQEHVQEKTLETVISESEQSLEELQQKVSAEERPTESEQEAESEQAEMYEDISEKAIEIPDTDMKKSPDTEVSASPEIRQETEICESEIPDAEISEEDARQYTPTESEQTADTEELEQKDISEEITDKQTETVEIDIPEEKHADIEEVSQQVIIQQKQQEPRPEITTQAVEQTDVSVTEKAQEAEADIPDEKDESVSSDIGEAVISSPHEEIFEEEPSGFKPIDEVQEVTEESPKESPVSEVQTLPEITQDVDICESEVPITEISEEVTDQDRPTELEEKVDISPLEEKMTEETEKAETDEQVDQETPLASPIEELSQEMVAGEKLLETDLEMTTPLLEQQEVFEETPDKTKETAESESMECTDEIISEPEQLFSPTLEQRDISDKPVETVEDAIGKSVDVVLSSELEGVLSDVKTDVEMQKLTEESHDTELETSEVMQQIQVCDSEKTAEDMVQEIETDERLMETTPGADSGMLEQQEVSEEIVGEPIDSSETDKMTRSEVSKLDRISQEKITEEKPQEPEVTTLNVEQQDTSEEYTTETEQKDTSVEREQAISVAIEEPVDILSEKVQETVPSDRKSDVESQDATEPIEKEEPISPEFSPETAICDLEIPFEKTEEVTAEERQQEPDEDIETQSFEQYPSGVITERPVEKAETESLEEKEPSDLDEISQDIVSEETLQQPKPEQEADTTSLEQKVILEDITDIPADPTFKEEPTVSSETDEMSDKVITEEKQKKLQPEVTTLALEQQDLSEEVAEKPAEAFATEPVDAVLADKIFEEGLSDVQPDVKVQQVTDESADKPLVTEGQDIPKVAQEAQICVSEVPMEDISEKITTEDKLSEEATDELSVTITTDSAAEKEPLLSADVDEVSQELGTKPQELQPEISTSELGKSEITEVAIHKQDETAEPEAFESAHADEISQVLVTEEKPQEPDQDLTTSPLEELETSLEVTDKPADPDFKEEESVAVALSADIGEAPEDAFTEEKPHELQPEMTCTTSEQQDISKEVEPVETEMEEAAEEKTREYESDIVTSSSEKATESDIREEPSVSAEAAMSMETQKELPQDMTTATSEQQDISENVIDKPTEMVDTDITLDVESVESAHDDEISQEVVTEEKTQESEQDITTSSLDKLDISEEADKPAESEIKEEEPAVSAEAAVSMETPKKLPQDMTTATSEQQDISENVIDKPTEMVDTDITLDVESVESAHDDEISQEVVTEEKTQESEQDITTSSLDKLDISEEADKPAESEIKEEEPAVSAEAAVSMETPKKMPQDMTSATSEQQDISEDVIDKPTEMVDTDITLDVESVESAHDDEISQEVVTEEKPQESEQDMNTSSLQKLDISEEADQSTESEIKEEEPAVSAEAAVCIETPKELPQDMTTATSEQQDIFEDVIDKPTENVDTDITLDVESVESAHDDEISQELATEEKPQESEQDMSTSSLDKLEISEEADKPAQSDIKEEEAAVSAHIDEGGPTEEKTQELQPEMTIVSSEEQDISEDVIDKPPEEVDTDITLDVEPVESAHDVEISQEMATEEKPQESEQDITSSSLQKLDISEEADQSTESEIKEEEPDVDIASVEATHKPIEKAETDSVALKQPSVSTDVGEMTQAVVSEETVDEPGREPTTSVSEHVEIREEVIDEQVEMDKSDATLAQEAFVSAHVDEMSRGTVTEEKSEGAELQVTTIPLDELEISEEDTDLTEEKPCTYADIDVVCQDEDSEGKTQESELQITTLSSEEHEISEEVTDKPTDTDFKLEQEPSLSADIDQVSQELAITASQPFSEESSEITEKATEVAEKDTQEIEPSLSTAVGEPIDAVLSKECLEEGPTDVDFETQKLIEESVEESPDTEEQDIIEVTQETKESSVNILEEQAKELQQETVEPGKPVDEELFISSDVTEMSHEVTAEEKTIEPEQEADTVSLEEDLSVDISDKATDPFEGEVSDERKTTPSSDIAQIDGEVVVEGKATKPEQEADTSAFVVEVSEEYTLKTKETSEIDVEVEKEQSLDADFEEEFILKSEEISETDVQVKKEQSLEVDVKDICSAAMTEEKLKVLDQDTSDEIADIPVVTAETYVAADDEDISLEVVSEKLAKEPEQEQATETEKEDDTATLEGDVLEEVADKPTKATETDILVEEELPVSADVEKTGQDFPDEDAKEPSQEAETEAVEQAISEEVSYTGPATLQMDIASEKEPSISSDVKEITEDVATEEAKECDKEFDSAVLEQDISQKVADKVVETEDIDVTLEEKPFVSPVVEVITSEVVPEEVAKIAEQEAESVALQTEIMDQDAVKLQETVEPDIAEGNELSASLDMEEFTQDLHTEYKDSQPEKEVDTPVKDEVSEATCDQPTESVETDIPLEEDLSVSVDIKEISREVLTEERSAEHEHEADEERSAEHEHEADTGDSEPRDISDKITKESAQLIVEADKCSEKEQEGQEKEALQEEPQSAAVVETLTPVDSGPDTVKVAASEEKVVTESQPCGELEQSIERQRQETDFEVKKLEVTVAVAQQPVIKNEFEDGDDIEIAESADETLHVQSTDEIVEVELPETDGGLHIDSSTVKEKPEVFELEDVMDILENGSGDEQEEDVVETLVREMEYERVPKTKEIDTLEQHPSIEQSDEHPEKEQSPSEIQKYSFIRADLESGDMTKEQVDHDLDVRHELVCSCQSKKVVEDEITKSVLPTEDSDEEVKYLGVC
ncbi:fap1 adhesin-like [Ptychodera flava]|uniref:fap1 adhesin-like n=1 Tax=Ptychodera flava TaxID=63121 RepID=UPI003969F4EA